MPVVSAGYFKTMPVYGAESRTPNHTQFRNNKTAGKRLALFQKKAGMVCLCQSGPVNRHSFKMALRQY